MSVTDLCYEDMPKVKFKTNVPVLVIGYARSGTTILIQLLRKYLDINYGPESQFIIRYYKRLNHYGDLSKQLNLKLLVNDISKERCFERWHKRFGFKVDVEKVIESIKEPTYRGVIDAFFNQFAEFAGRIRWGDKTPEYINDLPILNALFPEAQYIHIIRDGRDVALSSQGTFFSRKNIIQLAFSWQKAVKIGQSFGRQLPESRYFELKYETLMQEPDKVITQLAHFVQIEDGLQDVIKRIDRLIKHDLKKDNYYKWKKVMTPLQISQFERAAADTLHELGYDVINQNLPPLNAIERALSFVDDKFQRYKNSDYFKDNLYKLGLHTFFRRFIKR